MKKGPIHFGEVVRGPNSCCIAPDADPALHQTVESNVADRPNCFSKTGSKFQNRGMYDAQRELMQESFARSDQLLSREIARERELLEDDIANQGLIDWKVLSEETYEMEGEEIVFGSARLRRLMRRTYLVTIMTYIESSLSEVTSLLLDEANARRVGTGPGLRLEDFGHRNACHKCRIALTKTKDYKSTACQT